MLITTNISLKHRIPLPKHYQDLDAAERLALPKSDIPAVTHVDFSARVQTVDEQSNPKLTKLLRAFEQLTGYPCLSIQVLTYVANLLSAPLKMHTAVL